MSRWNAEPELQVWGVAVVGGVSDTQSRLISLLMLLAQLSAIVLGIVSTAILARDGLGFPLVEVLDQALQLQDDALSWLAMNTVEPIVISILRGLREFGVDLDLHAHWRHAFLLLWLLLGSIARATNPMVLSTAWLAAGACALVGGILSGLSPLVSYFIFWIPIACVLFFAWVVSGRGQPTPWFARLLILAAGGIALTYSLANDVARPLISRFDFSWMPAPLWLLLIFVLAVALALTDLREMEGRPVPRSQARAAGLNILSVLGGAAFLVWFGRAIS